MNRWKAAASHLALSILVVGGIALTIFKLWYPMGLYHLAGQDRIVLLMLGIDIAAGPLLTLIVYKHGKKSLRFDLAVIALAQLAFLGYGLHTLWQTRPVFLLGQPDRFTLVFANDIDPAALKDASKSEWQRLPWTGPKLVGTRMPTDPAQRSAVMQALFSGGGGIENSPRWYLDYSELAQDIARHARRIDAGDSALASAVAATGVPATSVRAHPVHSRFGSATMLVDSRDGTPLCVVP